MNPSINDVEITQRVAQQLRTCELELLYDMTPVRDWPVNNKISFAVYSATLSKSGRVFDAWIIFGGNRVGYYNRDNYSDAKDAVNQHIGMLVTSLTHKFEDKNDRKRARTEKS